MKLFLSDRVILDKLRTLVGPDGSVEISSHDLAAECMVHRNTITRSTQRLEDAGLITVSRRTETGKGAAGHLPNVYTVVLPDKVVQ